MFISEEHEAHTLGPLVVRYGVAVLVVCLAAGLTLTLPPVTTRTPFLFFFAAVMLSAWHGGFGPAVVALLLSVVWSTYFILPVHSLGREPHADMLRLSLFVLVSFLTSALYTRQQRATTMERLQREYWQTTLASISDGVIVSDARGNVTAMNPVAQRLTGWSLDTAQGNTLANVFVIVEETRQPVEDPARKVLCTGAVAGLANHTVLRSKQGTEIPIDDSAAPIRDAAGRLQGMVLVFRDITARRQAEAASLQLAAIIESSDDAIISKSLDGVVTSWNAAAERLFGYRAEEMIGQPILRLLPEERQDEERMILERLRQGERVENFETVRRSKEGRLLDMSITASPLRDAHGRIIGASKIARDITERKRAEEALRDSERRFRTLIEHSSDSIAVIDANNNILYLSPAVASVEGYTADELVGRNGIENTHPDDLPLLHEIVQQLLAHPGQPFPVLWRRRHKNGHWLWLEGVAVNLLHDPVVRGIVTNYRDVTNQKLAEQKLQAQLERLALLDHITRAIGERQDLQSIFQVVIRSLEDNLPIDFGCLCLYDPADEALIVTSVGVRSQSLALELALTEQATIPVDKNGLSRCVQGQLLYEPDIAEARLPFPQKLASAGLRSLVAVPLLVERNVFGVLIAVRRQAHSFSSGECEFLRQLSEQIALAAHQAQLYSALQRAYDDLRHTHQAVLQQERLRALGQMASGIAHDINNAITPIALYTESLLEQEPNLSERAREYLITMQRAIEDVAHTILRMREFYRQREPQLTLFPVDLTQLLQQVVDLTRARWSDIPQQRGVVIDLRTDLTPDLPAIMGVESELRDALTNLVFNAVDAMPEGGTLTLCTRAVSAPSPGDVSDSPTQVQVEVCDTGMGMDEETRRRCLEPFFTTKGERGTGLGLAMVYGIVHRHGAELEIESTVGIGTTVRLVFAAAVTEGQAISEVPTQAPSRLHLLIVDDDPLLLKALQDTLEGDGHLVVAANGGQKGIDAFGAAAQRGETFAAVITDLGMPYVDGRRVAIAIKTAAPTTPVILLTGWGQRLEAEGEVPLHVDRVLSKPPKLRELRATLAELTDNVTQTRRL